MRHRPRGGGEDFAGEVARLNAAAIAGQAGRLRELFDYLAARGPDAASASQAEIADTVFGQVPSEGDDATVRVYVHRLRKRLEDFYDKEGEGERAGRLVIPAGSYALRIARGPDLPAPVPAVPWYRRIQIAMAAGVAALLLAFLAGQWLSGPRAPRANAFWQPVAHSDRPLTIVVGDYYMFGELNAFDPDQSRLIRDFRIDGPTDLARAQEEEPQRYEKAEDIGLTYLPLASAFALKAIVPVVTREGREVTVIPASQLTPQALRDRDIVYVGLVSGMGLLEDVAFRGGTITPGETYDEFDDRVSRQRYTSEEMRRLASPVFYRDYGYFTRLRGPGGGWIVVIAGSRDTALRGMAPVLTRAELPEGVAQAAQGDVAIEGLLQVTGQQGADLSDRLLAVRERR